MSRRIEFKKIINLLTGNYLFPMTHGSSVVDDDGNAWSEKGAQVNVIEKVKVNGTALTPDADKAVNIELSQSEQIQSDWNQSDNTKKDFIKNKPTIPSISGLESASNKVTSFQTTPDNTHYPSEKLVKDSLDAKQNTIDSSHKLDYSLLDNTPTIPTVPTISTDISTDATSDTKTASPKAVKTYVDSNIPSVPVTDVTVGGTSVVSNGTAVIPAIPDTSNLIAKSSTTGLVKNDGTIDTNTYLTQHQDISGKADKVSGATSGNFAGLDANGNLTDSGKKPSDFLTQHQDMTNYVQKSQTAGLLKTASADRSDGITEFYINYFRHTLKSPVPY